MTNTHSRLADIAAKLLGIPTLTPRNSDRLDFHEVAVWQVEAALLAAFEAGRQATPVIPPDASIPTPFDDYEIQPCRPVRDTDKPHMSSVELCEPFEADFWTLYGHIPGEGVMAVGDFDTREHAEEVYARITGRRFA
ncbi:hypothetical protein CL52_16505 : Uncharacterized protein OS=Magnetospirillum gryphiswaldense MSR-1 v2 GN=MGMSRv2_2605 PE=4 SV=1 [Gemmataceae bacterium]|jgi:hypothetical protein|nr:hypothetical protein CL52_16505 : Uncharacterized protein OS=Magnetospirillum gryphiswaldense MSR-1 v2 GN=MGMSRv2_2605 PE=4 SV=1 [Gemmataceae bacterium]VTU01647.1 hypothetical protein CL52_16505 : Uncharacterized protein OS=Magnetospirillum gryphiswaldense MSR-1 v2 GN=MGMSRv2_2605 PE=4 SV=1 [Gemmataceae bacterium]